MVQLTVIVAVIVSVCIAGSNACGRDHDAPFFKRSAWAKEREHQWTWSSASPECMDQYIAKDGLGKHFKGVFAVVAVGKDQSAGHDMMKAMISKWWCLHQCELEFGAPAPWEISIDQGVGHVNSESPYQSKMRCNCIGRGYSETKSFKVIHDLWMANCYHNTTIPQLSYGGHGNGRSGHGLNGHSGDNDKSNARDHFYGNRHHHNRRHHHHG